MQIVHEPPTVAALATRLVLGILLMADGLIEIAAGSSARLFAMAESLGLPGETGLAVAIAQLAGGLAATIGLGLGTIAAVFLPVMALSLKSSTAAEGWIGPATRSGLL